MNENLEQIEKTKIGLCGVHGAGKTTYAKELHDRFVEDNKTVYKVHEVARSCPYALGTVEAQEYIWHNQMAQERGAVHANTDVIITDRTVLDNLIYYRDIIDNTFRIGDPNRFRWWELYHEAVAWMPTYDLVIRLPLNLEWLQADDPIRPRSETYARRIDALFDRFVEPFVTGESI